MRGGVSATRSLDELVAVCPDGARVIGDATVRPAGITIDSRSVRDGDLFVCIAGATVDGHDHAPAAVAAGAAALLCARPLAIDVPQLVTPDPRRAVGPVAASLYGDPSHDLDVIGITGTNGKTTTAHLLGAILRGCGRAARVHGTLSGARTTPEAPDLQARLAEARDAGDRAVVMEVSSHALALHRVDGTRFEVSVFTNLGHDHLDLHGSLEEYFRAKARLFTPSLSRRAVLNVDDPHGRLLADTVDLPVHPFGLADAADLEVRTASTTFRWRGVPVRVPLGGSVNVSNALAALTTAEVLGVAPSDAAVAIADAPPVPGRFELVAGPPEYPATVLVDYAHTPDGLDTLLRSVRGVTSEGRLLVVFGCGGDRDVDKRPLMGRVATDLADVVIVTSDNPRHEAPSAIAADIVSAMSSAARERTVVELDRRAAIGLAIERARPGDVVVVAGKGHESTQVIGDVVTPFDDRTVALEQLGIADGGGTPS